MINNKFMANKFEASLNTPKTPENGGDVEVMEEEFDSISKPKVSLEETNQIEAEDAANLKEAKDAIKFKSVNSQEIRKNNQEVVKNDREKAEEFKAQVKEVKNRVGKHFIQKFTAEREQGGLWGKIKASISDRVNITREAMTMGSLFAMLSYMEKKGLRVSGDPVIQEIGAGVMGAEKFSAYFNRGTSKQEEFEEKHIKKDIANMGGHSFGSGE